MRRGRPGCAPRRARCGSRSSQRFREAGTVTQQTRPFIPALPLLMAAASSPRHHTRTRGDAAPAARLAIHAAHSDGWAPQRLQLLLYARQAAAGAAIRLALETIKAASTPARRQGCSGGGGGQ
jgi:hypothetical protein